METTGRPKADSVTSAMLSHDYRVYKQRWLVLAVVCLLNFATATYTFGFVSITNFVDQYYCVSPGCRAANCFLLVVLFGNIPVGAVAIWLLDRYGVRLGILLSSWLLVVGGATRIVSLVELWPAALRLPIAIIGQLLVAVSFPFAAYMPTKVAAQWFAEGQRALAITAPLNAFPVGATVATFVAAAVIRSTDRLLLLSVIYMAPALAAAVLATVGVCSSVPPTPPSPSAVTESTPFWMGVRQVFKIRAYLAVFIFVGGTIGAINAICGLMQQVLCSQGYSNLFAATTNVVASVALLFASTITGRIVDRTKRFVAVIRAMHLLTAASAVALLFLLLKAGQHASILLALGVFTFGVFGQYAVGLEVAADVAYPVAQMTSAGIIMLSTQAHSVIALFLLPSLAQPSAADDFAGQTCTVASNGTQSTVLVYSWRTPLIVWAGYVIFCSLVAWTLFQPNLRRTLLEQRVRQTKLQLQDDASRR